MKRGFTVIELLVASLLLGMLITILTMIFNQSSIAWRIGTESIADLDRVRDQMAAIREEADNAILIPDAPKVVYRSVGLWDANGKLRKRACDDSQANNNNVDGWETIQMIAKPSDADMNKPSAFKSIPVGSGSVRNAKTYTVNVKSAGPDRKFDTYDDVWSWPDDFD